MEPRNGTTRSKMCGRKRISPNSKRNLSFYNGNNVSSKPAGLSRQRIVKNSDRNSSFYVTNNSSRFLKPAAVLLMCLCFWTSILSARCQSVRLGSDCSGTEDSSGLCIEDFEASGSGDFGYDVTDDDDRSEWDLTVCRRSRLTTWFSKSSEVGDVTYNMVKYCRYPDKVEFRVLSKCEDTDQDDPVQEVSSVLPVTSLTSNLTYFNHFCFLCSGDTGPEVTWSLNVSCSRWVALQSAETEEEVIHMAVRSPYCWVSLQPPADAAIAGCDVAAPEVAVPLDLPLPGPRVSFETGAPLSVLINFRGHAAPPGGGQEKGENSADQNEEEIECNESEFSIESVSRCVPMRCEEGKRLVGAECQSVFQKARGLFYSITLSLEAFVTVRAEDESSPTPDCSLEDALKLGVQKKMAFLHSEAYSMVASVPSQHSMKPLRSFRSVRGDEELYEHEKDDEDKEKGKKKGEKKTLEEGEKKKEEKKEEENLSLSSLPSSLEEEVYFDETRTEISDYTVDTLKQAQERSKTDAGGPSDPYLLGKRSITRNRTDEIPLSDEGFTKLTTYRWGKLTVWLDFVITQEVTRQEVETTALQFAKRDWLVPCGDTHVKLVPTLRHRHYGQDPRAVIPHSNTSVSETKIFWENATKSEYRHFLIQGGLKTLSVSPFLLCPFLVFPPEDFEVTNTARDVFIVSLYNVSVGLQETEFHLNEEGELEICRHTFIHGYLMHLTGTSDNMSNETLTIPLMVMVESYLSLICVSLSLLGLLATLLTYTFFRTLRTIPGKNVMALCSNLLVAQSLLQFGVRLPQQEEVCVVVGMLVHYAWLAALLWMNVCSFHMRRVFTTMHASRTSDTARCCTKRFACYTLYAQGLPLLIVAATAAGTTMASRGQDLGYGFSHSRAPAHGKANITDITAFGPRYVGQYGHVCYLSSPFLVGVAFVVPLALVIALNLLFFVQAVRAISRDAPVLHHRGGKAEINDTKAGKQKHDKVKGKEANSVDGWHQNGNEKVRRMPELGTLKEEESLAENEGGGSSKKDYKDGSQNKGHNLGAGKDAGQELFKGETPGRTEHDIIRVSPPVPSPRLDGGRSGTKQFKRGDGELCLERGEIGIVFKMKNDEDEDCCLRVQRAASAASLGKGKGGGSGTGLRGEDTENSFLPIPNSASMEQAMQGKFQTKRGTENSPTANRIAESVHKPNKGGEEEEEREPMLRRDLGRPGRSGLKAVPSSWRRNLNVCVRLSSLTGLFWTLGLMAEVLDMPVLRLVSVVANGSQGVLIAASYLPTRRVGRLYRRACSPCCVKAPRSINSSQNASGTTKITKNSSSASGNTTLSTSLDSK